MDHAQIDSHKDEIAAQRSQAAALSSRATQLETAVPAQSTQAKQKYRKEGYLNKRGKNSLSWEVWYFVLDGTTLTYYDAPNGQEMGRIRLSNSQIGKQQSLQNRSPSDSGDAAESAEDDAAEFAEYDQYRHGHVFLVVEPKRGDEKTLVHHVLLAESVAERDAWVAALLLHVEPRNEKASRVIPLGPGKRTYRF